MGDDYIGTSYLGTGRGFGGFQRDSSLMDGELQFQAYDLVY